MTTTPTTLRDIPRVPARSEVERQSLWLVGGAALAFAVPFVFADVLGIQRDVYYALYIGATVALFGAWATRTGGLARAMRRNWRWAVGLGVPVAALLGIGVARIEAVTAHPHGLRFAAVIAWRGVAYGFADGLLLSAFPILVVFAAFAGRRMLRRWHGRLAVGVLAVAASLAFTAVYHLGYPEFRGAKVRKPLAGDLVWSIPTLATLNPLGAPIAHVGMHVAAVVHSYDTNTFLPPHATAETPTALATPQVQGPARAQLASLSVTSRADPTPIPVVVDTDMSTDDILALLFLLQRPDVDIRAVIASGVGLAHAAAGSQNVLALLDVLGRRDVPVGAGLTSPLAGFNQFPTDWRMRADDFFGLELPVPTRRVEQRNGIDLLRFTIEASSTKTAIISLAPLTDTAAFLRAHPGLKSKVAAIYAMGGAVRVPGNIGAGHEHSEFNVWIDPVAAQEVVASHLPVTLVPLDATNQVPVTYFIWEALRRYHYATPAATLAWDLMTSAGMFYGGQYFWDPLAAASLTDPAMLRFAPKRLGVMTTQGPASGQIVEPIDGHWVRVALDADRPVFEHELLSTLLGGAPFTMPDARVAATVTYDGSACMYEGPRRGERGQGPVETVNRGDRTFTFVLGRLAEGRTVADLRRQLKRSKGVLKPSPWFTPEASGSTPPDSRMTWLVTLTPGGKAVVCTVEGQRRTVVVTGLTVTG